MNRLLAVAVVPVLLLGACSSSSGSSDAGPPASSSPAPASGDAGAGPAPTTSSPATSSPATSSPSPGASGRAMARCHTADLSITPGEGGAAAGTHSVNLVFTNKTSKTCSLYGYPGVSWVTGDNGTQVNSAFARESGDSGKATITLRAGGKAYALLLWPYYANYDSAQCKPVEVRGYRIYPPDETAAVFVSDPQTVCSAKGVGAGRVHPVSRAAG
ncbi:DUF4232 domain-containing protein [Actinoplanes bogorensis]|uniref:DUF4232 domain-containing protein n=1 Tax=Paractinoplanes bogorensis TaxID=1610840 RepID=A0ABS5YM36_9ACTN|nr:DUF4232 domain-containing protein [Actinoplanes bogorensis]MBU2664116.1 DUF4232 domain-containing protein [Actinoplanes bogorensis]